MTIVEQNLKRDMPGLTELLKNPKVTCGNCGQELRRDKCVIVVYSSRTDPAMLCHKSCANRIAVYNHIVIYSH